MCECKLNDDECPLCNIYTNYKHITEICKKCFVVYSRKTQKEINNFVSDFYLKNQRFPLPSEIDPFAYRVDMNPIKFFEQISVYKIFFTTNIMENPFVKCDFMDYYNDIKNEKTRFG